MSADQLLAAATHGVRRDLVARAGQRIRLEPRALESARTAGEAQALLERAVELPEDEPRPNGNHVEITVSGGVP